MLALGHKTSLPKDVSEPSAIPDRMGQMKAFQEILYFAESMVIQLNHPISFSTAPSRS